MAENIPSDHSDEDYFSDLDSESDDIPDIWNVTVDNVLKVINNGNTRSIANNLFYIEKLVASQLYPETYNLIDDKNCIILDEYCFSYPNIIKQLLAYDGGNHKALYEFYIRGDITYFKKESEIKSGAVENCDFYFFNLLLRTIGFRFYVETYDDMIVYKFHLPLRDSEDLFEERLNPIKINYSSKLMYEEFERQDPKILNFEIICSDMTIYLHSSIISQITQGIIKTLLNCEEVASIEAETNKITFRDFDSNVIKIYIKYLYYSINELSSVIKFDNIFEEIKMIDSVLNFVNFLDDTDFFNAILEYILNLDVNRHMNTLFQYKDIQSHNTVFERYLSGVKIQSERERNLGIFREIQRKYTTKLEFLGVSTLHISNIKAKNKIIFKTEEFGIISYSAGLLYSVVDHVNDVNDKYLTLNDEYNKNIQCCNKGKKIDGVLYVSDMETFLSTLSYSKFDPERKDIDPNMKYMTFVGTSKQICDGIERFQLNSKKKSSYDTNSKMKIIRHP